MTTAPVTAADPTARPLRLCLLADAGSVHTDRWARHFAGRGYDVHVFSLRAGSIPGVFVHHLVPLWPGKSGYPTVVFRLREMLRHLRPDLVHAHYLTSYGLLGVLAGVRPLIVSMWGSDVLDFPFKSPLHRRIVQWVLHRADMLMSTSEAMARTVKPWLAAGQTVHVTPFGVDTTLFHPAAALAEDPIVIGTAVHLIERKRIDLMLRAVATIAARPGAPDLRVLIAGGGVEQPALERLAVELGLQDRIEWLGWCDDAALADAVRRFSLMVVPSRQEAFGVVALEAAASGVPIVATRVDGFVESVAEGVSGVLVPPEDESALTAALTDLIADGEKRRAMGRSARDWVCRTYAWELTTARMERLYQALLSGHEPPSPVP
jgi:glycosyltransferase involved in cell wall biosynthesis